MNFQVLDKELRHLIVIKHGAMKLLCHSEVKGFYSLKLIFNDIFPEILQAQSVFMVDYKEFL